MAVKGPKRRRITIASLMLLIAVSGVVVWIARPKPVPPATKFTYFVGSFW